MASKNRALERSTEDNVIATGIELIPKRFYFVSLKSLQPHQRGNPNWEFFTIDDELIYEPFYEDFGPLNLAMLYLYCGIVNEKLQDPELKDKKIVHYSATAAKKRVNAAFLAGAYSIIYLKMEPLYVYNKMSKLYKFVDFRDASVGHAMYTISLKQCLIAISKALDCGFFNFKDFCCTDYFHYETVQHGDLNWIVPEKFLAFAGPQSREYRNSKLHCSMTSSHTPESFIQYFKQLNVTTVIRLNNKCYDAEKFTSAGIDHHDLIFPDGGVPSDDILKRFLKICEEAPGAVAVHCKAGLGRTGSLIACYIMKWYKFTPKEAIAWLRICRPASIIGHQQHWLQRKHTDMLIAGMDLPRPVHRFGIYSYKHGDSHIVTIRRLREQAKNAKRLAMDSLKKLETQVTTMNLSMGQNIKPIEDGKGLTQGDHLQHIKLERQSTTRNSSKALRNSWPMTLNALTTRRITTSVTTRKAVSVGKTPPPRRTSIRKKTPTKGSEENDASVAVTPTTNTPNTTVLRRSPRIMDPRHCKSMTLR